MGDIDSQHDTHGPAYAYANATYPEFYDLWTTRLFGSDTSSDIPIVLSTLNGALGSGEPGARDPVIFVDLGTGTGRVIKEILGASALPAHSPIALVGVDHSRAMLARAERTIAPLLAKLSDSSPATRVEWVEASATTYADALSQRALAPADAVLFSVGSIAHLTAPGELRAFLAQTAALLRAPGGVALVSFLDDFFVPAGIGALPPRAAELDEGMRLPAAERPGTTFVKLPTTEMWDMAGEVKTERFEVSLERAEDGEAIWRETLMWSLRVLREEVWLDEVHRAGLMVQEKHILGIQIMYVLARSL